MKFKCKLCKAVFEADSLENAVCPICGAKGDKLEVVTDAPANKYAGTKTEKNLMKCTIKIKNN